MRDVGPIYFAASIWGNPSDDEMCISLIGYLRNYGLVLSEKLFEPSYKSTEHLSMRAIHDRDLGWIQTSRVMVAEVSSPSLGVGYELREGIYLKKPILCLYRPQSGKRLSAMIAGSPEIKVASYTSREEAFHLVDCFFEKLSA